MSKLINRDLMHDDVVTGEQRQDQTPRVILLAIHGMGDTDRYFADCLFRGVKQSLGQLSTAVFFQPVFWDQVFYPHQAAMADRMRSENLHYFKIREFLLYSLSDAASVEGHQCESGSAYERVQQVIVSSLMRAYDRVGTQADVVIFAHSLGGWIISNYLWDCQLAQPRQGVWQHEGVWQHGSVWQHEGDWQHPLQDCADNTLKSWLKLQRLRLLYTAGCPLPLYLGGLDADEIEPIATDNERYQIRWCNFFDPDDVLAWPLKPINQAYHRAVAEDIEIKAAYGFWRRLIYGWNPMSHNEYWRAPCIHRILADDIRSLLNAPANLSTDSDSD